MALPTLLWNATAKDTVTDGLPPPLQPDFRPEMQSAPELTFSGSRSDLRNDEEKPTDTTDPMLEATKQYLQQVKAPAYLHLCQKAAEISAKHADLVDPKYIHEGDLELYTPDILAQREALTQSVKVIAAIEDIWAMVSSSVPRIATKMFQQFLEEKAGEAQAKRTAREGTSPPPEPQARSLPPTIQNVIESETNLWQEGVVTRRMYELVHRQFLLALAPLGTPQLQAQVRSIIEADWKADVGISEPEVPVLPAGVLLDPNTGMLPATRTTLFGDQGAPAGAGTVDSAALPDGSMEQSLRNEEERVGADTVPADPQGFIGGVDDNGGALWAEYIDWLQEIAKAGTDDKPKKKKEKPKPKTNRPGTASKPSDEAAAAQAETEALMRPGRKPISKAAAKLMMMNKRMFFASMFSITDIWTATVSEAEYTRFLRFLEEALKPTVNWKPGLDSPDEDILALSTIAEEGDVICRVKQYNERKKQEELAAAAAIEAARQAAAALAPSTAEGTLRIEDAPPRKVPKLKALVLARSLGSATARSSKSARPTSSTDEPTDADNNVQRAPSAGAMKAMKSVKSMKSKKQSSRSMAASVEPELDYVFEYADDSEDEASLDSYSAPSSPDTSLRMSGRKRAATASPLFGIDITEVEDTDDDEHENTAESVAVMEVIVSPRRHSIATSIPLPTAAKTSTEAAITVEGSDKPVAEAASAVAEVSMPGTRQPKVFKKRRPPRRQSMTAIAEGAGNVTQERAARVGVPNELVEPPAPKKQTRTKAQKSTKGKQANTSRGAPARGTLARLHSFQQPRRPARLPNKLISPRRDGAIKSALLHVLETEVAAAQAGYANDAIASGRQGTASTDHRKHTLEDGGVKHASSFHTATSSPRQQLLHTSFGENAFAEDNSGRESVQLGRAGTRNTDTAAPEIEIGESSIDVDATGWPTPKRPSPRPPSARLMKAASPPARVHTPVTSFVTGMTLNTRPVKHQQVERRSRRVSLQLDHGPTGVREILNTLGQRRFSAPTIMQPTVEFIRLPRSITIAEELVPSEIAAQMMAGLNARTAMWYAALQGTFSRRFRSAMLAEVLKASYKRTARRKVSSTPVSIARTQLESAQTSLHSLRTSSQGRVRSVVQPTNFDVGIPHQLEGLDPLLGKAVHASERSEVLRAPSQRQPSAEFLHERENIPVTTHIPFPAEVQRSSPRSPRPITPSAFQRRISAAMARPASKMHSPTYLAADEANTQPNTPRASITYHTDILRASQQLAQMYGGSIIKAHRSVRFVSDAELIEQSERFAIPVKPAWEDVAILQTVGAGFKALSTSPRAGPLVALDVVQPAIPAAVPTQGRLGKARKGFWTSLNVIPPWWQPEKLPIETGRPAPTVAADVDADVVEDANDLCINGKTTHATYFRVDPNSGKLVIVAKRQVPHVPTPMADSRRLVDTRPSSPKNKPFAASSRMWFMPSSLAVTGVNTSRSVSPNRPRTAAKYPQRPPSAIRPRSRLQGRPSTAKQETNGAHMLMVNSEGLSQHQAAAPVTSNSPVPQKPWKRSAPLTVEKVVAEKLPPVLQAQVIKRLVPVSSLPKPQYIRFLRDEVEFARGQMEREQAMMVLESKSARSIDAKASLASFLRNKKSAAAPDMLVTGDAAVESSTPDVKTEESRAASKPERPTTDRRVHEQVNPSPRVSRLLSQVPNTVEKALAAIIPSILRPRVLRQALTENKKPQEKTTEPPAKPTAASAIVASGTAVHISTAPTTTLSPKPPPSPLFPSKPDTARSSGGTHSGGRLVTGRSANKHGIRAVVVDGPLTGFVDNAIGTNASMASLPLPDDDRARVPETPVRAPISTEFFGLLEDNEMI